MTLGKKTEKGRRRAKSLRRAFSGISPEARSPSIGIEKTGAFVGRGKSTPLESSTSRVLSLKEYKKALGVMQCDSHDELGLGR